MKIDTENFIRFKRFIQMSLLSKENNKDDSVIGKYIYLDFENSLFHFASTEFVGKFMMSHTVENMNGFYVGAREFLSLCSTYDSLVVDEDYNFYDPSDKDNVFKIQYRIEDPLEFSVDYNDLDKFVINEEDFDTLKDSLRFMSVDSDSVRNLDGVRIYKDNIYSSTGYSLYKAKLKSLDLKSNKIDLTSSVIKAIIALPFTNVNIYFDFDNLSSYIKDDNDIFEIKFLSNNRLSLPEEDGLEKLKETYDHPYRLVVNKKEILKELEMLSSFTANTLNEKTIIKILNSDFISFKIESLNVVNHKMPIVSVDDNQIGYEVLVGRQVLYNSIDVINDEQIDISIDLANKGLRAIKITGSVNKNKMVALGVMT